MFNSLTEAIAFCNAQKNQFSILPASSTPEKTSSGVIWHNTAPFTVIIYD